ncbi:MAG: hypothetical protein ACI9R3_004654 [Verrucomicrobiales bacterium]|jgi:hypothetical protein
MRMRNSEAPLTTVMIPGIAAYAWFNRGSHCNVRTIITAIFAAAIGFTAIEAISNKAEKRQVDRNCPNSDCCTCPDACFCDSPLEFAGGFADEKGHVSGVVELEAGGE